MNVGTYIRHMWFETSVASVLGEYKGFVGCHAILNVAGCMHEQDDFSEISP